MVAPESVSSVEPNAKASEQVATAAEVEKAVWDLSPEDLQKLMLIANYFCRSRGLSNRTMEPKELLGEAIRSTLSLEKKWRKGLSIIKHLDRAMENISGHVLNRAQRETTPTDEEGNVLPIEEIAVAPGSVIDDVEFNEAYHNIRDAFADDPKAWAVLKLRMEGHAADEIRKNLNLSDCEYETVAKRIRRKAIKLRLN